MNREFEFTVVGLGGPTSHLTFGPALRASPGAPGQPPCDDNPGVTFATLVWKSIL